LVFFIIFLVSFSTVLVVHPYHDHLVTTVFTPVARYSLVVLKVPLNTNQTNKFWRFDF